MLLQLGILSCGSQISFSFICIPTVNSRTYTELLCDKTLIRFLSIAFTSEQRNSHKKKSFVLRIKLYYLVALFRTS